jgi:hypothetical protein
LLWLDAFSSREPAPTSRENAIGHRTHLEPRATKDRSHGVFLCLHHFSWVTPCASKDAGGVAKALAARGSLTVWQYAVRKAATGDLEQAPLHKIGLIASEALRVEPYATPLKVVPIDETKK